MRCIERRSLSDISESIDPGGAVSDLGVGIIENCYPQHMLTAIARRADALWDTGSRSPARFLELDHLRRVQDTIGEVAELATDPTRLELLSEVAGVELEPYPIPPATAHINHYVPGRLPIEFHTDGAALVELVPLETTGPAGEGRTLVYRGPADEGRARIAGGTPFTDDDLLRIPQQVGRSVLMQGRMLLHGVEALATGTRTTLVLALRSRSEPWKDGNTLARLLLDDELADVQQPWIDDQVHISDLYRRARTSTAVAV